MHDTDADEELALTLVEAILAYGSMALGIAVLAGLIWVLVS